MNKLILHPHFDTTIQEISKLNIKLPNRPTNLIVDFDLYTYPPDGDVVLQLEDEPKFHTDPFKGYEYYKYLNKNICAYDESFQFFKSLEGDAYLTSHSLVLFYEKDYLPLNYLTFYFYTRSNIITNDTKFICNTNDPETQSKIDYIEDRLEVLINNVPNNSLLFMDGPLIGKQMSSQTLELSDKLFKKGIIPIFFIKNSTSNLVINYIHSLKGKFNSDMHWSYTYLNNYERTCFFKYQDKIGNKAKVFCYIKSYDVSPQRVEFDVNIYRKYKRELNDIMNLIQYFILCQGDYKNPQIRPIAIAEKYARETIRLYDVYNIIKLYGIPTINQTRFG
ncbi:MAG: DNA double-strand break repair nuclease NurA [Candidatus Hodarchaeota archaeon]